MSSKYRNLFSYFIYSIYLVSTVKSIELDEKALVGLIPSVVTPLKENGDLNLDLVESIVKFLSDNGISGIIVADPVGEGPSLTYDEKVKLLDAYISAAKPVGLQVLLQVGGTPLKESIDLAAYGEKVKVDAIIALPDVYFKPSTIRELILYLKPIAAAAPNTPFMYLDYPTITNVNLNMVQLFVRAPCRIPNFIGIKTSVINALEILANVQLKPNQRVFTTTELATASVLGYGINATVSGIANVFPAEHAKIEKAIRAGDLDTAANTQLYINKIVAASGFTGSYTGLKDYISAIKFEMKIVNDIDPGPPRRPLPIIGEAKQKVLAQKLKSLGVEVNYDL